MTPEEKAVTEAAVDWHHLWERRPGGNHAALYDTVRALIYSCPECNAGGHTCPGDGNPIGHTASDCGEHDEPDPGVPGMSPAWIQTAMGNCLINDRIRLGADEATVLRSNRGIWNVDTRDYWEPKAWKHEEFRMALDVLPEFKQYPAGLAVEILCSPERLAVLRIQEGFPGSAPVSSDVD